MKIVYEFGATSGEAELLSAGAATTLQIAGQMAGQTGEPSAHTTHSAQVAQPEPGLFTVLLNGQMFRCWLDTQPDGQTEIVVNGQRIPITVYDKKHRRGTQAGAGAGAGKATLTAPMPGKIVRLLCDVGDELAAQQSVLVVEAMKMQNEVQTPKAGKLAQLNVTEGQTVNAGDVLAVIE